MYNLFQYSQDRLQKRQKSKQQQLYNGYLLRHQNYKKQAQINRKMRLDEFIDIQNSTPTPLLIPDEYMQKPIFENSKKSSNIFKLDRTKTPLLKQRQNRSESHTFDINLSHTKHMDQLNITKDDMKYLAFKSQMPNKKDRISQSAMSFNQKANKIMQSYEQTKERFDNIKVASRNRYRLCQITHFQQKLQNPQSILSRKISKRPLQSQQEKASISVYFSQIGEERLRSKTYFKLAKTTQLLTTDSTKKMKLNTLLSRSHYDRIKRATGIPRFTYWPQAIDQQSMANSVMIP